MPKAIWSGPIRFGLVNVPVKLHPAVAPKDVHFHLLEQGTGARIRAKRVSAKTGDEVPEDKVVLGYEVAPDRHVVISPEELETLGPGAARGIDIEAFVESDQIDPIYYERPYYLVPEPAATRAYQLLREAMRDSKTVAVARFVLRTKQHLAAVRPLGNALCLETLRFPDEVIPPESLDGLPGPEVGVSDRELKMARQLIESLSTDFEPQNYRDEHREQVLALIERKAQGQQIMARPAAEAATPAGDLLAALEASVAAAKTRGVHNAAAIGSAPT